MGSLEELLARIESWPGIVEEKRAQIDEEYAAMLREYREAQASAARR